MGPKWSLSFPSTESHSKHIDVKYRQDWKCWDPLAPVLLGTTNLNNKKYSQKNITHICQIEETINGNHNIFVFWQQKLFNDDIQILKLHNYKEVLICSYNIYG